jgi:hypothetical protein
MTSSSRSHSSLAGRAAPASAPKFAGLWAALTYAVCTLLLAWPALGGGFLVNPRSDQYIGGFPVRDFAAQALKAGQGIPQWNPYLFGGMPYIAAMGVGDIFYPTALLRLLLPTDLGMTWGFILHIFLAGCFTYGFLRAWGLGFYPALVGGIAYMMSGQVASLVSPGHDGKLFVSALFPLTLWLLVRGVRDGRHWAWGLLAITIGLAVLSPHPQLLQYMLLASGAFALYLALAERADGTRLTRRQAMTRLAFALGAVLVGFAIGAVQYLPFLEYIPYSPRAGGRGYEYATTYSMPIEELINTYLPEFSGLLDHYWGRNGIHLHSEYLGAAVLVLASAAFGEPARKSFRRFWVVTGLVTLVWALGGYTPFYHLVYALVPGSKFFRAPSTIFFITSFSVAVLAALGTERALAGAITRRFLLGWLVGAGVVALLATAGVFTSLAQSIAAGYAGSQLDEAISGLKPAVVVGAWRSFVFVALMAGLLLVAARRKLDARLLAWALAAIVALDLWSVDRNYWLFSPPANVIYGNDPATAYLKKAPTGRVLVYPSYGPGIVDRDPNFGGDALMVHGLRLVTGYHGNEVGRYQRLASGDAIGDYANRLNPNFWRLSNARYLYTNAKVDQPGLTPLLGPVKNSVGSTVYLYRLPGDNPPAWVAPAMVKAGDDATLGTLLDPRFDPMRVAVIDSSAPVQTQTLSALPEPINVVPTITRYDAGHIAMDLSAPAPAGSALVVAENYFPGWRATVNGQPAPVVRADYNLIGVPLPTGASRISLDFTDAAYQKGKVVTLLALLVALALVGGGALMERRQRVV